MRTNISVMDIIFEAATTDEHFEQILALQKKNHYSLISEAQQQQQGFVFAEHTSAILKSMATELPQVIALYNHKVVGYNLAMIAAMQDKIPSLMTMFQQFQKCAYQDKLLSSYKYIVGGQVCVDAQFRGLGLLSKLYHETIKRVPSSYDLCITEISTRNVISLNAHLKMGFVILNTYADEKEQWNIVGWDLKKLHHT